MQYTGKIIPIAFPDTFVRFSQEFSAHLLQLFGIGKNHVVKAGHAAMVLIENSTGEAEYYDFGRYITPLGKGRVRSAKTDVELEIPFKAIIDENAKLQNLEDFLIWLQTNPERTHGSGRMVACVCEHVNFEKAKSFVTKMQDQGSIPYLTFGKMGSNCSRIVTDTILAATENTEIKKGLLKNKKFTPSPLGNVGQSALGNTIYQVERGVVTEYPNSIFKENLTNYFDKKIPQSFYKQSVQLPKEFFKGKQLLKGIGSSAFFELQGTKEPDLYKILRYTEYGDLDFCGLFKENTSAFSIDQPFEFTYDSHCLFCTVEQKKHLYKFKLVKRIN